MARELKVRLGLDNASFKAKLNQSKNDLNQFSSAIRNAFSFAGGELLVQGIKKGFQETVTEGLNFNDTIQQATLGFKTMLKSAADATDQVQELWELAAVTPLEFKPLLAASRRLIAFKFEASEVTGMLRTIGDASAALGLASDGINRISIIDRISLALGQMKAKGKVSAEEMRQLSETGINAWEYLSEAVGKTTAETMKLTERGLIPAEDAIKVILEGMRRDFGGGMAELAKTYSGLMSTLKDTTSQTMGKIMEPAFKKLTDDILPEAIEKVEQFGKNFKDGGLKGGIIALFPERDTERIARSIDSITASFKILLETAGSAVGILGETGMLVVENWEAIGPIITGVAAAWTTYKIAVSAAAAAQALMNGLVNINPWMLLASAIVGVTAAIAGYNMVQSEMARQTINNAASKADEIEQTHKLIDEYYTLKQSAELTVAEKERLKSVEQQLIQKIPEAIKVIDDQTMAYAQQRDVLEQLIVTKNKDLLEAGKLKGEIALPGLERELESLKQEEEKARKWIEQYQKDIESSTISGRSRIMTDYIENQRWSNKLANLIEQRERVEDEIEKAKKAIEAYNKYVAQAEGNVYTQQLVDQIQQSYKEDPTRKKPSDNIEDTTSSITKLNASLNDGADYWKKLKDEMNSFFSEMRSQRDEFASFGNMFERNVIEKFSPAKIQSRLNRFLKQIEEWRANLNELTAKGVSDDILAGLRGMGLSGAGVVAGLNKMDLQQLSTALNSINQIRYAATQEAYQQVVYEHRINLNGAIDVRGYTDDGQLEKIKQIAAAEIADSLSSSQNLPLTGTGKRVISP